MHWPLATVPRCLFCLGLQFTTSLLGCISTPVTVCDRLSSLGQINQVVTADTAKPGTRNGDLVLLAKFVAPSSTLNPCDKLCGQNMADAFY